MAKKVVKEEAVWQQIKNEYIANEVSYRALAEKYRMSYSTVRSRAISENWPGEKEKFKVEVQKKVLDNLAEFKASELAKAYITSSKLLAKIEKSVETVKPSDRGGIKDLTAALKNMKDISLFKFDGEAELDKNITVIFKGDSDIEEYGK